MKKIFSTICALLLVVQGASAWTGSIHAGIAAIAHDNLTAEAKQGIVGILDGRSIVHSASRPADHHPYVAVNGKGKVLTAKKAAKSKDSQVQSALLLEDINLAIAALKSDKTPKAVKATMLKSLVSAIGDLHCPGHYIYTSALNYRHYSLRYVDEQTPRKYTDLWEGDMVYGTFGWKTNEFVHQLSRKRPEQVAALTAGTVTEWAEGNAAAYKALYENFENNRHFEKGIDYRLWMNTMYPVAIEQVAVAGYRLAALLNSIF